MNEDHGMSLDTYEFIFYPNLCFFPMIVCIDRDALLLSESSLNNSDSTLSLEYPVGSPPHYSTQGDPLPEGYGHNQPCPVYCITALVQENGTSAPMQASVTSNFNKAENKFNPGVVQPLPGIILQVNFWSVDTGDCRMSASETNGRALYKPWPT